MRPDETRSADDCRPGMDAAWQGWRLNGADPRMALPIPAPRKYFFLLRSSLTFGTRFLNGRSFHSGYFAKGQRTLVPNHAVKFGPLGA